MCVYMCVCVCVYKLAVINNAAVNMRIYIYFWVCVFISLGKIAKCGSTEP